MNSKIAHWTEEDRKNVLKACSRTVEDIQDDIESIKHWIKSQPHFPEMPRDTTIEYFIVTSKGSVERAKRKLDMYYTVRHFVPEMFHEHPLGRRMLDFYKSFCYITLPKLTKELYRVVICKALDTNVDKFNLQLFNCYWINVTELLILDDCSVGSITIVDGIGAKVGHISKLSPLQMKRAFTVFRKVYSGRVKAIHIVTDLPSVENLSNLLKILGNKKLSNRIFFHKSYEDLHKHFPKELLPIDYGGKETSLKELQAVQIRRFEEVRERFNELLKMKSKEDLRRGKPLNDEFFGFYGNFRRLSLD